MPASHQDPATVVVISRDGMGDAPRELRQRLAKSFLSLLLSNSMLPRVICFYGSGVHLVAEGSPVLEELGGLEARGVQLVACSTCLNYFGLHDVMRVGVAGGMGDILEAQWKADKVITL